MKADIYPTYFIKGNAEYPGPYILAYDFDHIARIVDKVNKFTGSEFIVEGRLESIMVHLPKSFEEIVLSTIHWN